jgi:hypothetical protein
LSGTQTAGAHEAQVVSTPQRSSTESGRRGRLDYGEATAGGGIAAAVKGLLIDGPGAGQVVDAGDPPVRRAVVVRGADGFGELAYRYYLESVGFDQATYRCAGEVEPAPEASSEIVRRLSDHRERLADTTAPGARLNGN